VEECRWVDQPGVEPAPVPEPRPGDEVSTLPRQRGFDELRERSWEGVDG